MGEATCCFFIISESTGIKTGNRDRSVCYAIGLQYVIAGWYLKAKFTGKNKKKPLEFSCYYTLSLAVVAKNMSL